MLLHQISTHGNSDAPFIVAMDDSLLRKTGKKIPPVQFYRDPLSPPFHPNLIRGQRFLQLSAAVSIPSGEARMIPVDFLDAPCAKKPGKRATDEETKLFLKMKKEMNINVYGAKILQNLRATLDRIHPHRSLWIQIDGRFTNKTILKQLPPRTHLTGRIRHDAKLYYPVSQAKTIPKGRIKRYGDRAPTPEQLRIDDSVPWQKVTAWMSGRYHSFKIKTLGPVLWRPAGYDQPLRVIVIAPLKYRLTKNGRVLYRQPGYLICTDMETPIQNILQCFVWRWDIEVNFRDEKQIIGVGEAQVRNKSSVQNVPAFAVASYGMLLLAAVKALGVTGVTTLIPPAKWYTRSKRRASTQDLQKQLRAEVWGEALNTVDFSGFSMETDPMDKPEKFIPSLTSSIIYSSS